MPAYSVNCGGSVVFNYEIDGNDVKNVSIEIPTYAGIPARLGASSHPSGLTAADITTSTLSFVFYLNNTPYNVYNHTGVSYPADVVPPNATFPSWGVTVYGTEIKIYVYCFAYVSDSGNSYLQREISDGGSKKLIATHTIDVNPPTISGPTFPNPSEISVVGSDIYCKNNTLTVTYTASDTGGSGLAGISIDGGPLQPSPASKTYTVTGDFTSTAYAQDNAGNQSLPPISKTFKFDNIPPTISNFIVNSATT